MKTRFPACLCALFLGGCATSYRVKIDSLAKPDADAISYSIRNADPTEAEDSLRYREAAQHVRTALSGRGLFEAPANVIPDVIVDLDYGVTPIVKREKRLQPATEQMPPQRKIDSEGAAIPPPPQRLELREITITTYEKYLHLTARENTPVKDGQPAVEIWKVDVTSEGESKDVRKYLPVLVAATIEYVGKDSHGQKSIRIKDTDADLIFVKKGM